MLTIQQQAEQMAESMGVDAPTFNWWIADMRGRVLAELDGNNNPTDEEFAVAFGAAHKKLSDLLREIAAGETFRSKVARKFITLSAYYELRGLDRETANQKAADETSKVFEAVDLGSEARRSLASLGL